MTTIKIGNQEVELEAARNLLFDANHPDTGQSTAAKSAADEHHLWCDECLDEVYAQ